MPSPKPGESHEGVLGNHNGLSPSQEARGKDSAELESRERLMPSPKPEGNHEGVLGSRNGLSPSQGARSKTQ